MTKKKQIYTGAQFGDALIRRQISVRLLAQQMGLNASTVFKWVKDGVPIKHESSVKQMLDTAEYKEYGAHHVDLYPETVKDSL